MEGSLNYVVVRWQSRLRKAFYSLMFKRRFFVHIGAVGSIYWMFTNLFISKMQTYHIVLPVLHPNCYSEKSASATSNALLSILRTLNDTRLLFFSLIGWEMRWPSSLWLRSSNPYQPICVSVFNSLSPPQAGKLHFFLKIFFKFLFFFRPPTIWEQFFAPNFFIIFGLNVFDWLDDFVSRMLWRG